MTKFVPLIDGNNKTVLQWTMIDSTGVEQSKSVPRNLWKLEKDWNEQEIYDFFNINTTTQTIEEEAVEEELEERVEELEEAVEELKAHVEKKVL